MQAGRQEKLVCGLFPFSSLALYSKFIIVVVFFGLLVT